MSKLKKFRMEAGLSQNALARIAKLDRATVAAAEQNKNVQELSMAKILTALSATLKRPITEDDVAA